MDRHEWTDLETGTGYFATAEAIAAPERPGLEGWRRAAAAAREILRLAAKVKELQISRNLGDIRPETRRAMLALAAAVGMEVTPITTAAEIASRAAARVKELEGLVRELEAGRGIQGWMFQLADAARMSLHQDTTAADIAAHAAATIKTLWSQRDEEAAARLDGFGEIRRLNRIISDRDGLISKQAEALRKEEARWRTMRRRAEAAEARVGELEGKLAEVKEWASEAVAALEPTSEATFQAIRDTAIRPWQDEVQTLKAELEKADMRAAEKTAAAAVFFDRWQQSEREKGAALVSQQARIDKLAQEDYQLRGGIHRAIQLLHRPGESVLEANLAALSVLRHAAGESPDQADRAGAGLTGEAAERKVGQRGEAKGAVSDGERL